MIQTKFKLSGQCFCLVRSCWTNFTTAT